MNNNKLSVKEKIGYGMGDAGCNIIFGAIMFTLLPLVSACWDCHSSAT